MAFTSARGYLARSPARCPLNFHMPFECFTLSMFSDLLVSHLWSFKFSSIPVISHSQVAQPDTSTSATNFSHHEFHLHSDWSVRPGTCGTSGRLAATGERPATGNAEARARHVAISGCRDMWSKGRSRHDRLMPPRKRHEQTSSRHCSMAVNTCALPLALHERSTATPQPWVWSPHYGAKAITPQLQNTVPTPPCKRTARKSLNYHVQISGMCDWITQTPCNATTLALILDACQDTSTTPTSSVSKQQFFR